MQKSIKVAVLGSTGYVGLELVYLLSLISKKENIIINFLGSENSVDEKINNFDQRIKKKLPRTKLNSEFAVNDSEILFLALPHKVSQEYVKKFIGKIKIIDLSADFRLDDEEIYNQNYDTQHSCPNLLNDFVYGLFEVNHKQISNAKNIAVPGCYPTSILIPLIPLLKENIIKNSNIIIDSKSGYSGAGKNFDKNNIFNPEYDLNFYNYNPYEHRHVCEIKQELEKFTSKEIEFSFNPHILPIFRGMMSSIYCDINNQYTLDQINSSLSKFYKDYKNIEIYSGDQRADFNCVQNTNKCIIKIFKHYSKSKITIVSLIDNLNKGAAGQAIQCMLGMQRN
ncbi:MAG: N-acetyl-gamma-glutamyl-phosphate reductase [Rickettsiales bacterium]|nr:N-acetyl-gamma-glutamyl-phosphate reductase [Rickettsiales bacterium]|tara:strand:- start:2108 stop:3121 length:1014 start_codon:yes stop_codon:yes gene_type:complete